MGQNTSLQFPFRLSGIPPVATAALVTMAIDSRSTPGTGHGSKSLTLLGTAVLAVFATNLLNWGVITGMVRRLSPFGV